MLSHQPLRAYYHGPPMDIAAFARERPRFQLAAGGKQGHYRSRCGHCVVLSSLHHKSVLMVPVARLSAAEAAEVLREFTAACAFDWRGWDMKRMMTRYEFRLGAPVDLERLDATLPHAYLDVRRVGFSRGPFTHVHADGRTTLVADSARQARAHLKVALPHLAACVKKPVPKL